jgi:hypothetical protein
MCILGGSITQNIIYETFSTNVMNRCRSPRQEGVSRVTRIYNLEIRQRLNYFYLKVGLHVIVTVEPGYNDIGLFDTSSITSHILWYQLIPHC